MFICLMTVEGLAGESFCPQLPIRSLCHGGHFQSVSIHSLSFSFLPRNLHLVSSGIPELSPPSLYSLLPEFQEAHCWQITYLSHLGPWDRGVLSVVFLRHYYLSFFSLYDVRHHLPTCIPKFPDIKLDSQSI